ncbi:hypothetical protein JZM32_06630 [Acinetobacter pittii]|uniref:hypothetical protein n=1 Tax=Acinetobacter calcoaceticus/baumannii complex TaxID=909768 RepID=UPI000A3324B6|nr:MULTISPECIES: hypothetical protein [Acinetobacter calcoaceticus/baumannii complex]MBN6527661.1 hypothetical protein [Acinetobacter pittii]MBN6536448.1 hypothetical protein [Acinetobacter pittii]MEB6671245.1 hypothetical protein [Acinetobacter pittii]OTK53329.1 hypothetical protein B9X70_04310 [Acinetobacter baumannii]OTM33276.1 hypothetical protein B9X47_13945 [Acinetobacter baumannii]
MEKLLWEIDSFRLTFFSRKEVVSQNIEQIIKLLDEKFMIEPYKKNYDESSGREIYVIRCSDSKYLHVILYKNRLDFEFTDTSDEKLDIYKIRFAFEEFISLMSMIFDKLNNLDIVRLGVGIETIYIADSLEKATYALKKYFNIIHVNDNEYDEISLKTSKKINFNNDIFNVFINDTLVGSSSKKIMVDDDGDFPEGKIIDACIIKIDVNTDAINKNKIIEFDCVLNKVVLLAKEKLVYKDSL